MGQCCINNAKQESPSSKLDFKSTQDLSYTTGLNPTQIRKIYKEFFTKYPDGHLTEENFKKVFRNFPGNIEESDCAKLFRRFDQDNSGTIDFREFMIAMSILSQGTLMQKLSLAFYLYDENGDGVLSYNEISGVVKAMHHAAKKPKSEEALSELESRAHALFTRLDVNKDGKVTIEEFINAAGNDVNVANLLVPTHLDRELVEFFKQNKTNNNV